MSITQTVTIASWVGVLDIIYWVEHPNYGYLSYFRPVYVLDSVVENNIPRRFVLLVHRLNKELDNVGY